jgi:hypothetical protein
MTKTAKRKLADALFSKRVRARGFCEIAGFDDLRCAGYLQTCHLISRRYLSVRFEEANAVAGCSAHHVYYTHHPLEWDEFCKAFLGANAWARMRRRAMDARGTPDYDTILARLREAA